MFTVRMDVSDRPALLEHLLALGSEDRRLRFGHIARDSSIERYSMDIDFERDALFGVQGTHGGRQFDGIMHLALDKDHAEIGVSVLEHARGLGIGSALVSRAAVHARNRSIDVLFMQCLSENGAIMRVARRLGMKVVTQGIDSEASMPLPAANAFSIMREKVTDQIALCDATLRELLLSHAPRVPIQLQSKRERAAAGKYI